MSDVVIIKKKSLILDHLIQILERQIHKSVISYEPNYYQGIFDREIFPETVLVEMENEQFYEMSQLIEKCSQEKRVNIIVWLTTSLTSNQEAELFSLNLAGYFRPDMEKQEICYAINAVFSAQRYI